MGLRKEFIQFLADKITDELILRDMIEVPDEVDVETQLYRVLEDELNAEDRLNAEVRVILEQYNDHMRQTGISYQEMFKLIKNELVRKKKIVL